jgi:integrase
LSAQTVVHIRDCLRAMLAKALKQEIIVRNVATAQFVDAPRLPHHQIAILTPEQARHFLDCAVGERHEFVYMLAISLALRKGEILALRWSDVDFEQGNLHINQTIQRLRTGSTEYGKRTAIVSAETKTACSRRSVPLPEFVVKALRTQKARQAEQRLAAGENWLDKTGLVFTDRHGRPIEQSLLQDDFKSLLEKAGLPLSMRFHDLRHVAASLLLLQGTHPKLVAELLGHTSIRMTLDRYSHLLAASKRETADTMALVFNR